MSSCTIWRYRLQLHHVQQMHRKTTCRCNSRHKTTLPIHLTHPRTSQMTLGTERMYIHQDYHFQLPDSCPVVVLGTYHQLLLVTIVELKRLIVDVTQLVFWIIVSMLLLSKKSRFLSTKIPHSQRYVLLLRFSWNVHRKDSAVPTLTIFACINTCNQSRRIFSLAMSPHPQWHLVGSLALMDLR